MANYRLTANAKDDLRRIYLEGLDKWGERALAHFAALKRLLDRDEPDYLH